MAPVDPVAPAPSRSDRGWLLAAALVTLVFYLVTARGFGIFRDEFYYLACGRHLAFGYVDHPPLIALLTRLFTAVFGDSVVALRVLPSLAAAGTVWLAGDLARRFGGGRFAQLLTALAVLVAPILLSLFTILSMNSVDILLWTAAFWLAADLLQQGPSKAWLLFGVVAGLGLHNKLSFLFLGFGLVVGLLLAREWRHLRSPYLYVGGALAGLIFLPHVLWQQANGWPTLEFIRNATETKNVALAPLDFLGTQLLFVGPLACWLWLAGLGWLLVSKAARPWRALGWTYPVILLVMLLQNAKPYYLAPAYPLLFAAGAVIVERWTRRGADVPGWRPWLRVAAVLLVLSNAMAAPTAKPLLSVEQTIAHARMLGQEPGTDERKEVGALSQYFADMHGWPAMARTVSRAYQQLSPQDQERACFFGNNYGQAGAVEYYAGKIPLPPAISSHNNYFLWGPRDCTADPLLLFSRDARRLRELFEHVEQVEFFDCAYCMPYEDEQPLWLVRGPKQPIGVVWPELKNYS